MAVVLHLHSKSPGLYKASLGCVAPMRINNDAEGKKQEGTVGANVRIKKEHKAMIKEW